LEDGEGMLDAAKVLMQQQAKSNREYMRLLGPTCFLLGHGIEVALKSVLRAHGSSVDELRNVIRHNLDKAVEQVIALNLDPLSGFVASNARLVWMLNPYYRAKVFEHRVTGFKSLPPTEELAAFLGQLLELAEPQPKRSASRQPT
jgi:hypothetical protein